MHALLISFSNKSANLIHSLKKIRYVAMDSILYFKYDVQVLPSNRISVIFFKNSVNEEQTLTFSFPIFPFF